MKVLHLTKVICFAFLCAFFWGTPVQAQSSSDYTLVVEGYDWGPAVSKVIVALGAPGPFAARGQGSARARA